MTFTWYVGAQVGRFSVVPKGLLPESAYFSSPITKARVTYNRPDVYFPMLSNKIITYSTVVKKLPQNWQK